MSITALAIALSLAAAPAVGAATLSHLQWDKRVLVIFAEDNAPDLARQIDLLSGDDAGLAERDMLVVAVTDDSVAPIYGIDDRLNADQLRRTLDASGSTFEAVLVGKDGSVKHRQSAPISRDDLFAIIDAMPMRQR